MNKKMYIIHLVIDTIIDIIDVIMQNAEQQDSQVVVIIIKLFLLYKKMHISVQLRSRTINKNGRRRNTKRKKMYKRKINSTVLELLDLIFLIWRHHP